MKRFTVHHQSTTCPDGYDRSLFYVWDDATASIVSADYERAVCEGDAARWNRTGQS